MNKWQAIDAFWSSFGIPAYDENSVPEDATAPYITYTAETADFEKVILLTGSIWYKSATWENISLKADEIASSLKRIIKLDDGYLFITRGSPFAQRMKDPNENVKRIYINLMCEFYTSS